MKLSEKIKTLQMLFINQGNKTKYPQDTEEVVNIKEIIVPAEFQRTRPRAEKIIEYTKRFEKNGMIDTAISVKKGLVFGVEKYILTDGYIRLIILRQNGIDDVPIKIEE